MNSNLEAPERRHSWRLWFHATVEICKIAFFISAAHLTMKMVAYFPIIVEEIKKQSILVQEIRDDLRLHLKDLHK